MSDIHRSSMNRRDWLALVQEPALDADLPIIDPHHHLWNWPNHRYLGEELLADCAGGHRIVATVFVECMSGYRADGPAALRPVGETEFVIGEVERAEAAAERLGVPATQRIELAAGIVGFADLTLGAAVDAVLDQHRESGRGRFRGIRHACGWDPSPEIENSHTQPYSGLMADPMFREGFSRLAAHGLSFDAWCFHPQLPELLALARAFPDTTIVLDHFGGPLGSGPYAGRRAEIFDWCKRHLQELAGLPNVVAKLGGMAMVRSGYGWHKCETPLTSEAFVAAYGDWYRFAIDVFGPERCMFESNFPVDRASISYGVLWNAFKRLADGFSSAEKAALFHGTAQRVYRLPTAWPTCIGAP
ncbi:MAG: amidohydrolase family protein [Burkholderiaceae bacterium]